jgi:hypothetical protein
VRLVLLVRKVLLALRVQQAQRERQVLRVLLVQLGQQDHKD